MRWSYLPCHLIECEVPRRIAPQKGVYAVKDINATMNENRLKNAKLALDNASSEGPAKMTILNT